MKTITHIKQQKVWDMEHKKPQTLLQMDSNEASSGVVKFFHWLNKKGVNQNLKGIELGCGKGRNVIWLAKQGYEMTGIDFSPVAIKEAKKRAKEDEVEKKAKFIVHDATKKWPFEDSSFNLVIDCFASTDIESEIGRKFASKEMQRILKSGGYLLVYVMSTDDEYHAEMIKTSPAKEKNAFIHPKSGKFEKVFDKEELLELYGSLKLVKHQRIPKKAEFFGKSYDCLHHWLIFKLTL